MRETSSEALVSEVPQRSAVWNDHDGQGREMLWLASAETGDQVQALCCRGWTLRGHAISKLMCP